MTRSRQTEASLWVRRSSFFPFSLFHMCLRRRNGFMPSPSPSQRSISSSVVAGERCCISASPPLDVICGLLSTTVSMAGLASGGVFLHLRYELCPPFHRFCGVLGVCVEGSRIQAGFERRLRWPRSFHRHNSGSGCLTRRTNAAVGCPGHAAAGRVIRWGWAWLLLDV